MVVGQLSDPYQQGDDDELGITISGLPGELHDPDDPPVDAADRGPATAGDGTDPADASDVPTDAAGPASHAGTPEGEGEGDGEGDGVAYDLDDWSELERQAITDRLREAGIPHGWEGTTLQVAVEDEAAVENVLDIVEGEADEPLDGERDQVAYNLSEWDDDQASSLDHELSEAGIAHAWDGDELYVYAEDEQTVDDLFERVSHPNELAVEDDDGTAGGELLGEVFVAVDRLSRDPEDHQGAVAVVVSGKAMDPEVPPYGVGKPEWSHLCERVTGLSDLLRASPLDEEGVIEAAGDLRTALRMYV